LIYTSVNPVTAKFDGAAAVALGNRPAYHDNIIVMQQRRTSNSVFYEDFSGDLSKWNLSSYGGSSPTISDSIGNPAPGFFTNSDFGFAVSKQTFHYIGNDFSLTTDLKPGSDSYKYATLFLTRTNSISSSGGYPAVEWIIKVSIISQYRGDGPAAMFEVVHGEDAQNLEVSSLIGLAGKTTIDAGDWYRVQCLIDKADGKVRFYVNGSLIYTSVNPVTAKFDGAAAVALGNRPAYHDNIIVMQGNVKSSNGNPGMPLLLLNK
jgi:hypothetical protein